MAFEVSLLISDVFGSISQDWGPGGEGDQLGFRPPPLVPEAGEAILPGLTQGLATWLSGLVRKSEVEELPHFRVLAANVLPSFCLNSVA